MAARWIYALLGVVESCRSDMLLKYLKSVFLYSLSFKNSSVSILRGSLSATPTCKVSAPEIASMYHSVVCIFEVLHRMLADARLRSGLRENWHASQESVR